MNIHLVSDAKSKIEADINKIKSMAFNLNFPEAIIEYLEDCLADCDHEDEEE